MEDNLFLKDTYNEDTSHRLMLPAAVSVATAPVTNINASNQSSSEGGRGGDKSNVRK